MSGFQFPPLYIGCPVEFSSDPSESDKTLGHVVRAMPQSADVATVLGEYRFDCWHADDPRCISHPQVFGEPDNPRGVIRLTEGEVHRRLMFQRLDAMELKLAEFSGELRRLDQDLKEQKRNTKPKKRGRPRKTEIDEAHCAEEDLEPVGA